jgi:hypothetical protein
VQVLPGPEGRRVYSPAGVSITLTSTAGGFGGKTGLYDVTLHIKVMTKSGYQLAHPGDSIDLAYATMNTRRGRVGDKIAHTVTPGNNQGYFFIDLNEDPSLTENARCLLANQGTGIGKFKGGRSGVFVENSKAPCVAHYFVVREFNSRQKAKTPILYPRFGTFEFQPLWTKKPRNRAVFRPNIFLVFLGWWRWRESNPRPKEGRRGFLRA